MGIRVQRAGPDGVVVEAPLRPVNVNHQSTAFGGSVAAVAILTGWAYVHLRLRDAALDAQTVIQSSSVQYAAPIRGPFQAATQPISERDWDRFVRGILRHRKARVDVSVDVSGDGDAPPGATFTGAYVALRQEL